MGLRIAVVGATGNVGREMLSILEEREFPADEVVALASRKSIGVEVSYGDRTLKCKDLDTFDFTGFDVCLMSAGGTVSKEWSPKIGAQGVVVIDNSSAWRMDPRVPLVVPEVNPDAVLDYGKLNIVANPNCSTAQLVVTLKPLHDHAKIKVMSGTWVQVGDLRLSAISAAAPAVQDAVVTGHDREEVGLLIFPNLTGCGAVCGAPDAPLSQLVTRPELHAHLAKTLGAFNAANPGTSRQVARVLLMTEPPSVDGNEITDKGYINQRAVLENRASLVQRLYSETPQPDVVVIPRKAVPARQTAA